MTFDSSKPVQTRDGRKARPGETINTASGKRMLVIITDINGWECAYDYHLDGKFLYSDEHPNDLINIPEKRWAVLFEDKHWFAYDDEDAAIIGAKEYAGVIACVEFTEGQGI